MYKAGLWCIQAQVEALQEAQHFKAPTLRKSTRERIEEAEKERQRAEQVHPTTCSLPLPVFCLGQCLLASAEIGSCSQHLYRHRCLVLLFGKYVLCDQGRKMSYDCRQPLLLSYAGKAWHHLLCWCLVPQHALCRLCDGLACAKRQCIKVSWHRSGPRRRQ